MPRALDPCLDTTAASSLPLPFALRTALPAASRIGRYAILGVLGKGGMGVVYAAYDPELDRKVALKLLHPTASGAEDMRARLVREAQAMARLSHPNVVTIYDVGSSDEQAFVALELVEGTTLRAWLDERPRRWRDVVRMFVAAGQGLVAAHEVGLVHRDFKPENVLVDLAGVPRVTDFGLARLALDAAPRGPSTPSRTIDLTTTGAWVGTPAYMAPEQFQAEPTGAFTDQFSFCVALWEGLFGQRPFAGDTIITLSDAVTRGDLRDPPAAADVPSWLRRALIRGLAVAPAERHPSMHALLAELGRDRTRRWRRIAAAAALGTALIAGGLAGRGATSDAPDVCGGAERELGRVWDARHKQAIRAAFGATGAGYAEAAWRDVEPALDAYGGRWTALHTATCEATRVRGDQSEQVMGLRMTCLERRLGELSAVTEALTAADASVVAHAPDMVRALPNVDVCNDTEALLGKVPPPSDPQVLARLHAVQAQLARAHVLTQAAKFDDAAPLLTAAVEAARLLDYPPVEAEASFELAQLKLATGDAKASEALAREAALLAARGRDDHLRARAHVGIAAALRRESRYDDGLDHLRQAEAVSARGPTDDVFAADLLEHRGALLTFAGKYAEAEQALNRARTITERGGDRLAVAANLAGLADLYNQWGKYDAALEHYRRALALYEQILGPAHPVIARNLINLTVPLIAAGRFDEARAAAERALAITETVFGHDHLQTAGIHIALGNLAAQQNQLDESILQFERALAIQQAALGREAPDVADTMGNLGELYRARGRYARALELRLRALEILEKRKGHDHPELAYDLAGIAKIYIDQNRPADAIPLFERALELQRTSANRGTAASIQVTLAGALWVVGKDPQRARELARTARDSFAALGGVYEPYVAKVDALLAAHPAR